MSLLNKLSMFFDNHYSFLIGIKEPPELATEKYWRFGSNILSNHPCDEINFTEKIFSSRFYNKPINQGKAKQYSSKKAKNPK